MNGEKIQSSEVPVTKLIIERESLRGELSSGTMELRMLSIGRRFTEKDKVRPLFRLNQLSNTQAVQLCIRETDGSLTEITLPKGMLNKIAEYTRQGHHSQSGGFDCGSFVHFIYDIPYTFGHFEPEKWNTEFVRSELEIHKIGALVFLADVPLGESLRNTAQIKHFAMYIGDGLFLSKMSHDSTMIVGTLAEMKKGYACNEVYTIQPKTEAWEK